MEEADDDDDGLFEESLETLDEEAEAHSELLWAPPLPNELPDGDDDELLLLLPDEGLVDP